MGDSAIVERYGPALAPEGCIGGRGALFLRHLLVQSHSGALGDPANSSDGVLCDDSIVEAACGAARRIRCEGAGLLVESAAVLLLLVRRGGLRAGPGAVAMGAWAILHDLCAALMVRLGMEWFLRGALHLLQAGRAGGHSALVAGGQACDRTAVVASLYSVAVLLALVLCAYCHWRLVRLHELLGALHHV